MFCRIRPQTAGEGPALPTNDRSALRMTVASQSSGGSAPAVTTQEACSLSRAIDTVYLHSACVSPIPVRQETDLPFRARQTRSGVIGRS